MQPVGSSDFLAMKRAAELRTGKLEKSLSPDPFFLSLKLREVEQNTPTASPLTDFLSEEDMGPGEEMPTQDIGGGLR